MKNNLYYKKYVEKVIQANPTPIIISRIQKISDGFDGWIEERVKLPPQTVSIYNRKFHRERLSDSGATIGYLSSTAEKLLCGSDTDIMQGDRFQNQGREYKVTWVHVYDDICKQVELEVISDG